MRSAILGAYFADAPTRRREFVLASSRLTHRGWQAEIAALAVAESVALAVRSQHQPDVAQILSTLRPLSQQEEWQKLLSQIESCLSTGDSVANLVKSLGLKDGVSGYALHVVPVAVYAWLRHEGDFRTTLIAALECGGDTDTVGAILGAMAGASGGEQSIPAQWLSRILAWPYSCLLVRQVAARLAEQKATQRALGPVRYFWPALIPRNLLFLAIVMAHGFRRLAPPY